MRNTTVIGGVELAVSELLAERAATVYRVLSSVFDLVGDIAECGVYEGVTTGGMARLAAFAAPAKVVHAFDSFEGLPPTITDEERGLAEGNGLHPGAYAAEARATRRRLSRLANVEVHPGRFEDTFPASDRPLCFVHSDSDLLESTVLTIKLAARCLVPGGVVLFDDFGNPRFPGVELAVQRALSPSLFLGGRLPGSIQYVARRR
jgi:O-methyltransferase